MGFIGSIFGFVLSLPFTVLGWVLWIGSSIVRPLTVVSIIIVLSKPQAAQYKLQLFTNTISYLLFCKDKKWKYEPISIEPLLSSIETTSIIDSNPQNDENTDDNGNDKDTSEVKSTTTTTSITKEDKIKLLKKKTVIFVRHGESTWNDTFNKGDRKMTNFILYFIPNLFYAIFIEWYFWISGQYMESWFYDSPLSSKGLQQANGLRQFLQKDPSFLLPKEASLQAIMKGGDVKNDSDTTCNSLLCSSQLVSSNLRRAISTIAVGFQDRLKEGYNDDTIILMSSLQEISRNPDALCISLPNEPLRPAWTDPYVIRKLYTKDGHRIDTKTMHTGNKDIKGNGLQRLQQFADAVFHSITKDCIIAGGHSLWFKEFFKLYLPPDYDHISKKKKLINGGAVGFTLEQYNINDTGSEKIHYRIDPKSIVILHGGF